MSAAIPYVAPWQTNFERYATQPYTPARVSNNVLRLVVAEPQWWRIVYVAGRYDTSAAAGTRTCALEILDAGGTLVFQEFASSVVAASSIMTFLFALGVTSFASTADALHQQATTPIPDSLWPPGVTIQLMIYGADAGDGWITPTTFSMEVYSESRPGVLAPEPVTATPAFT